MIELVSHTEKNDTVFHTEKTGMLRLVVEIDVVGMTADVVDKVTCSFDGCQLKQVDLKRKSVLKKVLMIELVSHTEKNDTVFHTEKTGMLRLVVEIDVVGMIADVVDK
nr:hypothetical protein [Tanacetum cinerariifolium]